MKRGEEKSIWMRDPRGEASGDMLDLAYAPSGGRGKQWLAGVVLAAVPVIYGICSIQRGWTTMFGSRGMDERISGDAGFWLAVAYIAIGAFCHFHWFWGLSERLWRFSEGMKVAALLVFLPAFGWGMWVAFV
ncbi:hypothetical protein [Luteolibacter soli]|uniref:Uncharacterized protein n=1 Tax=Luteolibacter soli TaxID=3135280 RepID=A0ABU9AYA6_9BACT